MAMKKGKEFIFPENVDNKYGIWKGYTLMDFVAIIIPSLIVGLIFIAIPPHGVVWLILKVAIVSILEVGVFGVITVRPVKARPNVTLRSHLQMKGAYSKRQHLFFQQTNKEVE